MHAHPCAIMMGIKWYKYVSPSLTCAAANLEPVEQGRIVHRSLPSFFSGCGGLTAGAGSAA